MSPESRQPADLDDIVTIRWYANTLENVALQRYMGSKATIDDIKAILYDAHARLTNVAMQCQDCNLRCCENGDCSPDCMGLWGSMVHLIREGWRPPEGWTPPREWAPTGGWPEPR